MVSRLRLHAFAGGRQYLVLYIGYVKLHLYIDLWGVKMTFFDQIMRYDIVNYQDFCTAAKWYLDWMRFQILTEIDINECLIGLIGQFTDDTSDCVWATYYINHPFLDIDVWESHKTGDIYKNGCGEIANYPV